MKFYQFLNNLLVSGFYIGKIPGAPGTWASIAAVILLYFFPVLNNIYIILVLLGLGIFTGNYDEIYTGLKDNPQVVIDEMVGMLITFAYLKRDPWVLITGFLLFRFFDIAKFSVINYSQKFPGGWGVMLDDVLAGIAANIILRILVFYFSG